MPIKVNPSETKDEFISRCIGEEISSGKDQDVAAGICYSVWEEERMSKFKHLKGLVKKF